MDARPYDLDDALCEAAGLDGALQWRLYRVDAPLVVLGRGSQILHELNIAACLDDVVHVTRRRGGGCAVVLDPGNVIVSVAIPMTGIGDNKRYLETLTEWIIAGLTRLGYEGVLRQGVSDIVWRDRKVSGSCIHRTKDLLYYSASLLVDADPTLLERYLAHPPREPAYRAGRTHGAFVGTLATGRYPTAAVLLPALREVLGAPPLGR